MPRTVTVPQSWRSRLRIGGDMLAMEGSRTQKTPELIERTTKSSGRGYALEARIGRYRSLMPRWSCSRRLFRYTLVRCRTALPSSLRIAPDRHHDRRS